MNTYRVEDPETAQITESFDVISDAQLEASVAQAVDAQQLLATWSTQQRAVAMRQAAALLVERKDELAHLIGQEMGKRHSEGVEEVTFSAEILTYYADHAEKFLTPEPLPDADGSAMLERLPMGVLIGVMPWNFPYYQVARFAGPNLVLGNTILLKHAEICPRSSAALEEIFRAAGFPQGAYTNVYATHEQVAQLIADPRTAGVSLTGSERAGAAVGAQAGQHLKKSVLELGGSDAWVVLDAADVKAAAQLAWETRMYNMGQACDSNKRMIIMDAIYDEFVEELVSLATKMTPGNYQNGDLRTYQPLSSRAAAEQLAQQVQDAVDEGATLRVGGELSATGAYFSPAVLTDVPLGSYAFHEELFGPVATVYRVSSDEEAVALANDSHFGLGGAVFSDDSARAEAVAQQLHVGMARVNAASLDKAGLPFGGVKRSGYGRELGPLGIDEFANKRLYYVSHSH